MLACSNCVSNKCSFNTFCRSNQLVFFFLYRTSCWRSAGTNPRTLKKTWRKHSTAAASFTSTTTARVPLWVKSTGISFCLFFLFLGTMRSWFAWSILWKSLNCLSYFLFIQRCFHDTLSPSCNSCSNIIQQYTGEVLRFVGGIGLFFSFTEVSKCWDNKADELI